MLAILFPHMFEELEYLLPETAMEANADRDEVRPEAERFSRDCTQPVAGPSRLK